MTEVKTGGAKSASVDYSALKRGGFMRQKQKNLFSLRLHNVGGALSTKDLVHISKIADKYGNGTVHLTSRQGVEIPFVKLEDVEAIRQSLAEYGLAAGVCGPRVRTVTACQGNTVCGSAHIDTQDIAKKLDERYFGQELPHKFKFGVTGCHNNCLKAEENDLGIKGSCKVSWIEEPCIGCGICVKVCKDQALTLEDGKITVNYDRCSSCGRCAKACPVDAWDTKEGCFSLYFGGSFGNELIYGHSAVPVIEDEETLFRVTDAAVDYFKEHAHKGERLGHLLGRIGSDDFDKKMMEAYRG